MLTFNYGSPYFWDKVVLTKLISGCRMVWDLIFGTSSFYKSKTEKVTGGGMSAILPNCCCLLSITVLSTPPPLMYVQNKVPKLDRFLVLSFTTLENDFFAKYWRLIFILFCFVVTLVLDTLTSGNQSYFWKKFPQ